MSEKKNLYIFVFTILSSSHCRLGVSTSIRRRTRLLQCLYVSRLVILSDTVAFCLGYRVLSMIFDRIERDRRIYERRRPERFRICLTIRRGYFLHVNPRTLVAEFCKRTQNNGHRIPKPVRPGNFKREGIRFVLNDSRVRVTGTPCIGAASDGRRKIK